MCLGIARTCAEPHPTPPPRLVLPTASRSVPFRHQPPRGPAWAGSCQRFLCPPVPLCSPGGQARHPHEHVCVRGGPAWRPGFGPSGGGGLWFCVPVLARSPELFTLTVGGPGLLPLSPTEAPRGLDLLHDHGQLWAGAPRARMAPTGSAWGPVFSAAAGRCAESRCFSALCPGFGF